MPPPLVLLHPFPFDGTFWNPVAARLAADRAVHVPEFPGFGVAAPVRDPSIDGAADAVAERIGAQCPGGRAVVCGVSMGGYIALALAARHPGRVAGLILSGTRAEADDAAGRAGRHAGADRVLAGDRAGYLDELIPGAVAPGNHDALATVAGIAAVQTPEAIAGALLAMARRADRVADLPAMDMPALVLRGTEDALIPAASAATLQAGLPDAVGHTVPGAGHLIPAERPAVFLELAAELLARADRAG